MCIPFFRFFRFKIAVKIDGQEEPVEIKCAYVSFCYKIKLEPSGP